MSEIKISESDLIANFPFKQIRNKQLEGMKQIAQAINNGFKVIVLEAPTGFGKSPVAVALARTLGSSYICSATKDLQSQYTKDFPFLRSVKGMSNYECLAKEDFILNKSYMCKSCGINQKEEKANNPGLDQYILRTSNIEQCRHKTVSYGPCREDNNNASYEHVRKYCALCSNSRYSYDEEKNSHTDDDEEDNTTNSSFHDGCRYRTFPEDYQISSINTDEELVFIKPERLAQYHEHSTDNSDSMSGWIHLKNITNEAAIENRTLNDFIPCPYYDQFHKGMLASHTIFNYANFLIFLRRSGPNSKNPVLKNKSLLVLDEGHQIENQVVEDVGINISKKTLQRYLPPKYIEDIFDYSGLDYDSDIQTEWLKFLQSIYAKLDESIIQLLKGEVKTDAKQYLEKLAETIALIEDDVDNWIVSEIVYDNGEQRIIDSEIILEKLPRITKVVFKPLDVSPYCRALFELTDITLIMSATILDVDTFCHNIGLDRDKVKFIEMPSEFPIENRPIYQMNTAYLNYKNLKIDKIHRKIAASIDRIMDYHSDEKGIIHTTSYSQVNFIKSLLNEHNRSRLISTDPNIPRDEIIAKHWKNGNSNGIDKENNSVLISPSLHTGLDLKNEQSRFQILVKVPYPSLGDRWIKKKQTLDNGKWYRWQTVLKIVQAYGRSIRSKDDWAKTYLLDASFDNFIRTNKFPKWFLEALMLCPHQQQII